MKLWPLLLVPALWAVDPVALDRIRREGFERSRAMEHLFYLTDVHGPRLTGSPGWRAAAEWAAARFREFGIPRAALEPWEGFGRGWSCTNFEAHLEQPRYAPLNGFALPWSPGTGGLVRGTPTLAVITSAADFPRFHGKLRGALVLLDPPRTPAMRTTAPDRRFTAASLERERLLPDDATPSDFAPRSPDRILSRAAQRKWHDQLDRFLVDEGVRLVIRSSPGGEYGNVYGNGAGYPAPNTVDPPPTIVLANEHYNRLARLLEYKQPVAIAVDVQATTTARAEAANVIAEIPGATRPEEVVMLGAHLDSWTGGTGATDDAAGCAVVMEAMRILQAAAGRPARTIRAALWSGEEQGILGSQAWVRAHPTEHARISVYLNYDFGAGRVRGLYLQNNNAARPVFEQWLQPVADLGAATLTLRNSGGTDHLSFDAAGIPAFQFIQDPLDYGWRTHHHSMDTFERVPPGDAIQSAVVLATLVWQAANAPAMVPRKVRP